MLIAILCSVTVSIGEETKGTLSAILRVNREFNWTCVLSVWRVLRRTGERRRQKKWGGGGLFLA